VFVDSLGDTLGPFHDWELFELKSFSAIEPLANDDRILKRNSMPAIQRKSNQVVYCALNGRIAGPSQTSEKMHAGFFRIVMIKTGANQLH